MNPKSETSETSETRDEAILISTREILTSAIFTGDFEMIRKIQNLDIYELMMLISENPTNAITLHRLGKINKNNINEYILDVILMRSLIFEYRAGVEFWYEESVRNNLPTLIGLEKICQYYPDNLINLKPKLQLEEIPNMYIESNILIKLLQGFPKEKIISEWLVKDNWPGVVGKYFFSPGMNLETIFTVRKMYLLDIIPNIFETGKFEQLVQLSDIKFFNSAISGHSIESIAPGRVIINKETLEISDDSMYKLIEYGYLNKIDQNVEIFVNLINYGRYDAIKKYLSENRINYFENLVLTKSNFDILLQFIPPESMWRIVKKNNDIYFAKKFVNKYPNKKFTWNDISNFPLILDIISYSEKTEILKDENYVYFTNLCLSKGYTPQYIPEFLSEVSILESGNLKLLSRVKDKFIAENIRYLTCQGLAKMVLKYGVEFLDDFKTKKIIDFAIRKNNVFRIKYLYSLGKLPKIIKITLGSGVDMSDMENYTTALIRHLGSDIEVV